MARKILEWFCLWRAVDHEGEVLEVFASKRRDRKAALEFLKSWLPVLESDPYPERKTEVANWIKSLEKELEPAHSP